MKAQKQLLLNMGIRQARIRQHGKIAGIEVSNISDMTVLEKPNTVFKLI